MVSKKIVAAKSNLRRLVSYLLDGRGKGDRVAEVIVRNCHSQEPDWAMREMVVVQKLNDRALGDKTCHLVVSFAPGEEVTSETIGQVETRFAQALGFAEHQRITVLHRDTDCVHFHMAINKIHPVRHTLHEPFNDYHTREKLCQELEIELGLVQARAKDREREMPAAEKAAALEAVAGVESLAGFVQRTLRKAALEATSWQELHDAFAKEGVALKQRANGLVVESGEQFTKASSCFRELSKAALEKRFGAFQANGQTAGQERGGDYRPKPLQQGAASLYDQYQAERKSLKVRQEAQHAQALAAHRKRISEAKSQYRMQKSIVKLTNRGQMSRLMLKLHQLGLKGRMRASYATYLEDKKAIHQSGKLLAWNDWLMRQAGQGNASALAALQWREKRQQAQAGAAPAIEIKPNQQPDYDNRPTRGAAENFVLRAIRRIAALFQSHAGKAKTGRPAQRLSGLRDLSAVPVVREQPPVEVLLHPDARDGLGDEGANHPAMRREGTGPDRDEGQPGEFIPSQYVTRRGSLRGATPAKVAAREKAKEPELER